MPITDKDVLGMDVNRDVVEVTPPGTSVAVMLRCPPFAEWHELAVAHAKCERVGDQPSASLIVKTLAYTITDKDGRRRLTDKEAEVLMNGSPVTVMWLYRKAWQTVLRNDEKLIAELEGNSEANRG